VKTSNTNSTGKQGSNFLVPKKDEEYSSSEDKNLRMYLRLTKKKMKKLKEMTNMTKKNTYNRKNNGLMDDEDTDEEEKYGETLMMIMKV